MERPRVLAVGAVVVFAVAWFLPVEQAGVTLSDGVLPGYQAFMVAIAPALLHRPAELDLITIRELLSALSALSNLLVPYALAVVLWWPRPGWPSLRRLSNLLLLAFVLNAQWIWPRGGEFLDLRTGYWLWCTSFALLVIALRWLDRSPRDGALVPGRH